jgi:antitoxin CcdA
MRIPNADHSRWARKKAVNVSVRSDLLDQARAEDINLSATLEAALADQLRRRDRWRTENEAAIEAYNRDVAGKEYLMFTPQLAGIAVRELGTLVDSVPSERGKIIGALDLLITGISQTGC